MGWQGTDGLGQANNEEVWQKSMQLSWTHKWTLPLYSASRAFVQLLYNLLSVFASYYHTDTGLGS